MNQNNHGLVIVVDDDPYVLEATSLLLKEQRYSPVSCNNARDAIERLQTASVDAVLSDIVMPEMTGLELLEKIHDIAPEIPVILMTAYADMDKAIDAIKKGAFDFIIKPYKSEQLTNSVKKAVNYRRLTQMKDDYRHILEDMNQAFETLVAERTMSLMALTVADRVRNPAAVIGGTCKRIIEKGKVSEELREAIKSVADEVEKLENVVSDFQNILKSRQSMFEHDDINRVVESVISVIEREASYKKVEMFLKLSKEMLKINMQKGLLRVAIYHILRNAIEATGEGGRVTITTSADNDNVTLTISDTGIGIPKEAIDKLFEPFFSTKDLRFGMGLPLVRQIVSEHMGEIKVESEIGKGTTFKMIFPVRWK